ncbi:MAG: M23 family metallopeptidase, partial [Frankiales bacterium]|nr:M23 family metallopeptidase [Frankiales bacterium]
GHRGVDLPAPAGTAVRAAGAGRVSYAGLLAGRGVVVVVHGTLRTTYEPVDAVVMVGDVVGLGEPLGLLEPGHAGCPVAACLHWGLRRGEDYLDPARLVQATRVRLLPLGSDAVPALPPGSGPAAGSSALAPRAPALASTAPALASTAPALASSAPAPSAAVRPPVVLPGEPRSFDVPLGALAAAALLAGIALLARPRPHPPEPPALGAGGSPSLDALEDPPRVIAPVIGLDEERALRRGA